jgi:hypothetical protein
MAAPIVADAGYIREMSLFGDPRGGAAGRGTLAPRFARAARYALAGLVLPPVLLALASSAGLPLTGLLREALTGFTVAGFAACGAACGTALDGERRNRAVMAGTYVLTGLLVSPAFSSLQGLTGHEPALVVVTVVAGAFAAGFAIAAGSGALVLGATRLATAEACGLGAAAGLAGGACALLPFGLVAAGAHRGTGYVAMAVAVASILGCLILPNRLVGAALDRTRRRLARDPTLG